MKQQRNRLSFSPHGLLMELILVCGFFLLAASLFLLVFFKAGRLSTLARDTQAALDAAQTIVESAVPEGEYADGERDYIIYYGSDWRPLETLEPAGSTGSGFYASAHVTEAWDDGFLSIEAVICLSDGTELYRLSAGRDFS